MKVTHEELDALLQMSIDSNEACSYMRSETLVIADRSLVTLTLKNGKWSLSTGSPDLLGETGLGFYHSVVNTSYPVLNDDEMVTRERHKKMDGAHLARKNQPGGYNAQRARQVSIRFNDGTDIVLPSLKDTTAYLNQIGPVSMSSVGRWATGSNDTYLTRYSYLNIYSITYI